MRDRPFYVAWVCWFLVLANAWWLIHAFHFVDSDSMQKEIKQLPLPPHVQVVKYFTGLAVPLVCGIFMSQGMNWARVLYIGWGLINYSIEAALVPDKMKVLWPGLTVFAACALVLMLPRPGRWFTLPRHYS